MLYYRDEPSIASGSPVTAYLMNSLDFARDIFSVLGIYSHDVLAAGYSMNTTGNAKCFAALMKANKALQIHSCHSRRNK